MFSCRLCQQSEFEERATRKVDDLLESYMGIRDLELGKGAHVALVSLKIDAAFQSECECGDANHG